MSRAGPQAAFAAWWEARCRAYLAECFGGVEAELRSQFTGLLFPPTAEPTLPEQALVLAFVHLRLLAGEDLGIVLKRLERLAALFGAAGAKPKVGTLYLVLTVLTSTPGRISSLVRAQTAFFSLLLRRVAGLLDRGMGEEAIRRELNEHWDIRGQEAAAATLDGARGMWRRTRDARLGVKPLPVELDAWLAENALGEEAGLARRMFPPAGGGQHLAPIIERLAAFEALRRGIEGRPEEPRRPAWGEMQASLMESISGGLEGLSPWEAEALRPSPPLLGSLLAWANRLRLLEGGEAPTAYPGRERLPDWLREFLARPPEGGEGPAAGRFLVGGATYLVVGIDANAPADVAALGLSPPAREDGERLLLGVRFGDGTERTFGYDLTDGRDLLAALHLAEQPDIRCDLLVRGEDGVWRFGASFYLVPDAEARNTWVRYLFEYLGRSLGGEEDRIKLEILRGVEG